MTTPEQPEIKLYAGGELAMLLEEWRRRAFAVCRHRGWSLHHDVRLSKHIQESAELTEALRGKRGPDAEIEEAGDLLFTALAMIPERIALVDVLDTNLQKIADLLTKPRYASEDIGDPE